MSDLESRFIEAAEAVQNLPQRPSNDQLLKLYALYKQASTGDVAGSRPGFLDMAGRAKYDAWAKLEGLESDEAKQQYIDYVKELAASMQDA